MAINTDFDNQQSVKNQSKTNYDLRCGRTFAKLASTALTSASNATSMDCSQSDSFTYTPTEASTITATGMQPNQTVRILFLTSGASSYVITFGTGMHSTGTLATGTDDGKYFVVVFTANVAGSALFEASRTAAM